MPVFFEDNAFKYEITRWRRRHIVTAKVRGHSAVATPSAVAKLGEVFGAFDIVKDITLEQKRIMTIWAYRYFCLGVAGTMAGQEYWDATPAQEIVILLLTEWLENGSQI